MILAAGRGTRLRPLTDTLPKPLALVDGLPLIEHQIRWLEKVGIREVVVNVHHLAEQLITHLSNRVQTDVRISFSREDSLLNTGGGIVQALPLLGNQPFILLNGDIWTDFPFQTLIQQTTTHAHLILRDYSIGKTSRDFDLQRGVLVRPSLETKRHYTYCGIALINPRIFRDRSAIPFSLTRDLLFDLIDEGKITGEQYDGAWRDIGTKPDFESVQNRAGPT